MFAAEHEARPFQKHRQQTEFCSCECDLDAIVVGQGPAVGIKHPSVEGQSVPGKAATNDAPPVGSAQDRLDPGQQLTRIEGFGQIVVGPDLQPHDTVSFITQGCQHQDRNGPLRTQTSADREAIFARHHHIQHDQIELTHLHRRIHCDGIGGRSRAHAVLFQIFHQGIADITVVIDDQNMRRLGHHLVS